MISPFSSPAVVHWLWRATWEASLLCLLVWGIQTALHRKLPAQWSFALWWLVIFRLLVPASIPAPWSVFNLLSSGSKPAASFEARAVPLLARPAAQSAGPVPLVVPEPGPVGAAGLSTGDGVSGRWFLGVLGWTWSFGVAVLVIRLLFANWRVSRLLRRGGAVADAQILALLEECARVLRLRQAPRLVCTSRLDSPAVVGCFRPSLMLPKQLCTGLSRSELRHVFLHEMAHIRRRDLVLNWLLCALEALHWFNPILRYAFRRIRADRELACDALALSRMEPREGHSYGRTILKLLESLTRPGATPGLIGLLEEKQLIKRRIDMITHKPARHPALAAALFAALGLFTLTDAQPADHGVATGGVPGGTHVQAGESVANPELINQEREIDKQHLQRIYNAIRAYYKDRHDLPNWLSDLVPQYLPDAGDLISPIETRTGKSVLFGREDPRIHTSYIYEFNAAPAPEEFNKGRAVPLTCKEWKLMQLQKFGMITPILRSHIDQPVLNVAYSGQIYSTGLLWENDPNTAALVQANPRLGPQSQLGGVRVSVHVVETDGDAPVSGAVVRDGIGSEFGLLPPGQGTTDANGNLSVPLGEWKVNFLFLNASHEGYYPVGTNWNREQAQEDSPPTQITLQMTRAPGK